MNILLLGPQSPFITTFLIKNGYTVFEHAEPIDTSFLNSKNISFAISYRYRHIVKPEIIDYLKGNIINLHISYLPWNRGSDPNLWSFLEDTPKGVSIHYVDPGIDTGDIITQKEITFDESFATLSSTYEILNNEIVQIFKDKWEQIINGSSSRIKQKGNGSFHRSKDKEPYEYLLQEKGWDTPVVNIKGKALTTPNKK